MRFKVALLALLMGLLYLTLPGCQMDVPLRRPGPGPRAPAPIRPAAPGVDIRSARKAALLPSAFIGPAPVVAGPPAQLGLPDLSGGPEDGTRPHEDPVTPPWGVYMRGDPHLRMAALTFDDGPDNHFTPQILDVLRQEDARATFFIVGWRALHRPDIVRRIVAEGHEVGNHSMTHAFLPKASPERLRTELAGTDRILRTLAGHPIAVFRPPYGAVNPRIMAEAGALDYKVVLWDVDSLDWKRGTTRDEVLRNVIAGARNGAIILEHSAGGHGEDLSDTAQALPVIIRTLKARGFQLVTLSELLDTGNVRAGVW